MQFVLTGFTHESGFRVFAFEHVGADRVRTKCTVKADLALVRQYGIHVQELPLLCRRLLDQRDEGDASRASTFGEDAMRACASERNAAREAAALRRRTPKTPTAENTGAAWRTQQR